MRGREDELARGRTQLINFVIFVKYFEPFVVKIEFGNVKM
jgi:hypothetical protein